ncbi:hypothetical protein Val02_07190 [Virgisporangium aliadipatigenens]|uniref:Alpha/beta hydrolase n=1 Tax=Virgisporangium aliadipatigenens TaxID=741659 RepID=A0A8J3YGK3_9ACTN|nr:dienelactone hydrolase family protein [Virgisporangium aliadipatigenens]GIJ43833.1 hypothetical protein Val02_07190 [Virgisporangium aliadipatigenens]
MRFTSRASSDGVLTREFLLDGIPAVLRTPDGATGTRPLVLIGHGGGQHKAAPGVVARAHRLVSECGYAVAAVDAPAHGGRPRSPEHERLIGALRAGGDPTPVLTELHAHLAAQSVPEWRAVLDALRTLDGVGEGPVGYVGMSLGCALGVPFVAAEPRVRAAVLGLNGAGTSVEAARRITAPVEFVLQWDDERVPRDAALALFDAFGSTEKTLHANPGGHGDVPAFETDSAIRFLRRHLG